MKARIFKYLREVSNRRIVLESVRSELAHDTHSEVQMHEHSDGSEEC